MGKESIVKPAIDADQSTLFPFITPSHLTKDTACFCYGIFLLSFFSISFKFGEICRLFGLDLENGYK